MRRLGRGTGQEVRSDKMQAWSMGAYARQMALLPQHGAAQVEEVLEVDHGGDGVAEKADEVRERDVRDAVG